MLAGRLGHCARRCERAALKAQRSSSERWTSTFSARGAAVKEDSVSLRSAPVRPVSGVSAEEHKRIYALAAKKATGISLRQLYSFGLPARPKDGGEVKDEEAYRNTLLAAAKFLYHELPIRMAHRIVELEALPYGLADIPEIVSVAKWYATSVSDILNFPEPTTMQQEKDFTQRIQRIYQRHGPTLVTMARGIAEFKRRQGVKTTAPLLPEVEAQVQRFLDVFYTSRIGIRTLIEQHLALHEPVEGYVGVINSATKPVRVCQSAIADAQLMCERALGDSPEVIVYGDGEFRFEFIDSFLHHIVFELVKNATRAVVETHSLNGVMPPVRVIVAAGSANEDVVIKVSDEGGGIPRSGMPHIWSYFYTSANSVAFNSISGQEDDFSTNTPLAGLGYGLPLSRLYARYFGGELQVISMEGYGTDAYVHLKRVGDADEPVPPVMKELRDRIQLAQLARV